MEDKEYDELLEKLEAERATDPVNFERKVQGFIRLGYFFFVGLGIFFLLIMLSPILMWTLTKSGRGSLYLFIAGAAGLFSVVRILFLKYEAPRGEALAYEDAPVLFKRVEELGKSIGAPPITSISLIDDLNAFASAVPKYFLLGKPDLHVSIGIPLLAFMRPEEVDEVIAHELAHHTNRDTDTSLKVFRVMEVWRMLASNGGSWIDWSPMFARWYYPRLAAMSSVLSRDMEFAADRLAAKAVGNEVAITAHFRLAFAATRRHSDFTDRVRKAAEVLDEPFPDRLKRLLEVAREPVEIKREALVAEGRRVSLTGDSHPTLRERVEAIGGKLASDDSAFLAELESLLIAPLEETGIDRYLDGPESALSRKINLKWQKEQSDGWKSFRTSRAFSQKIVEEYQARTVPLTPFEHINFAYHLGATGRREDAIEYLKLRLSESPDNLNMIRMYALMTFAVDKEKGEPLIEGLSKYPAFAFETDEHKYDLLQSRGQTIEAEALAKKLREGAEGWYRKYEEIMPWQDTSIAEPPGAAQAEIDFIREVVGRSPQAESAYFARMSIPDLPGLSRRVLLITINMGRFYADAEDQYEKLSSKIFADLDDLSSTDIRILPSKEKDAKIASAKLTPFQIYSSR